jgi:hypothetical protein
MKINATYSEIAAQRTRAEGKRADGSQATFADLLHRASSGTDTASVPQAGQDILRPAPSLSPHQDEALAAGEDALRLLEHYEALLTGPNLDASSLDTVAEALAEQTEGLRNLRDRLDMHDPLREAIDSIGVLTVVESAKIIRGDYGA